MDNIFTLKLSGEGGFFFRTVCCLFCRKPFFEVRGGSNPGPKIFVGFILLLPLVLLTGCGGSMALQPSAQLSPNAVLFDDFETGGLGGGGWTWGDTANGSRCTMTVAQQGAKLGKYCWKIDYKFGKGWGCGAAETSSYEGKGLDVTSDKMIVLWVKAPDSLAFKIQLNTHLDNQVYPFVSPAQQGVGRWWFYQVPLDQFTPELSVPQGMEKIQKVDSVGFELSSNQKDSTLWVDNIYFQ